MNSAGRTDSPWTNGRTGPAPPEGVGPPIFLRVSATSAVLVIHPPARPNGIISLYKVFSLSHKNHTLVNNITLVLSFEESSLSSLPVSVITPSSSPAISSSSLVVTDLKYKLTSPSSSCSSQRGHPISRLSMVYSLTPSTG